MSTIQWELVKAQLPPDEEIFRIYTAFEGDLRIITKNSRTGDERRYTVNESTGNITLKP